MDKLANESGWQNWQIFSPDKNFQLYGNIVVTLLLPYQWLLCCSSFVFKAMRSLRVFHDLISFEPQVLAGMHAALGQLSSLFILLLKLFEVNYLIYGD